MVILFSVSYTHGLLQVCGCPIINCISANMIFDSEDFCQKAKLKCDEHYNWENTALAEIDLEHLKQVN